MQYSILGTSKNAPTNKTTSNTETTQTKKMKAKSI